MRCCGKEKVRPVQGESLKDSRILIVDDQEANIGLMERMLKRSGYTNFKSITDPRLSLTLLVEFEPDLILLDLNMPYMDGYEVMEQLEYVVPDGIYLPILVLTADITAEAKQRALSMGAKDFLSKPFDVTEVLLRIKNLLETRSLHLQLQNQNQILEEKVRERTRDLDEARLEILARLARAAEFRDDATGKHTQRVGRTSALLARELGLPDDEVELLRHAAPLHDVGKIGIPDHVLLKPGRLTLEESERMKSHTVIGANILSGSAVSLLQLAEEIARSHHERWDGAGYPRALKGDAIPLTGRIVSLADVFDALTHERPYKKAWPEEEAVAELERQKGRQFDPRVVEAFLKVRGRENILTT